MSALSQYEVRHYASNLSAFTPESVQRAITAGLVCRDDGR